MLEMEIEEVRDFLAGMHDSIYKNGNMDQLEHCLEEACSIMSVNFEPQEIKLNITRSKEMNTSPEINEIVKAMAAVQGTIKGAKKDKKNPFFKSDYADLSSCWECCRDALSKNNVALIQTTELIEGKLNLITLLAHESGQWIRSSLPVITDKADPQTLGKTITYLRRFSLCAVVGIAPADDDAESLMNRNNKPETNIYKKAEPKTEPKIEKKKLISISTKEWSDLEYLICDNDSLRGNLIKFMTKKWNIKSLKDMPTVFYSQALTRAKEDAAAAEAKTLKEAV